MIDIVNLQLMQSQSKKRYRTQYLIYRCKTKQDYTLLQKEIILCFQNEQKLFNKSEYVDNYIFYVFDDKIVAMAHQKSILQSIKYLFGYTLTEQQKKYQHFCQVDVVLNLSDINRSKLPSQYKFVFQNQETRVQKMDEFLGHKLRDLLSYPQALMKKLNINKSDYLYYKTPQENSNTESSDSDSDDSDSDSDSDSSGSSDSSSSSSEDSRKRKEKKAKKEKQKKKQKEKSKEGKKKKNKERDRSKSKKDKKEKKNKKIKKSKKKKESKQRKKKSKQRQDKKKKQRSKSKEKKKDKAKEKDKKK